MQDNSQFKLMTRARLALEGAVNYLRDGCAHTNVSWPIDSAHRPTTGSGRQVCVDCSMYRYVQDFGASASSWQRPAILREVRQ